MSEVKSKIYTRKGDDGSTGLVGGKRLSKGDLRLECYGTVDELNAMIGRVIAGLSPESFSVLSKQLSEIQNQLFNLGSRLACVNPKLLETLPPIEASQVKQMEIWIDQMTAPLPPLQNFILPTGAVVACDLHVARTIARRAERAMVRLHTDEPLDPELLHYINRLSDYLFVASRWCNHLLQIPETLWQK